MPITENLFRFEITTLSLQFPNGCRFRAPLPSPNSKSPPQVCWRCFQIFYLPLPLSKPILVRVVCVCVYTTVLASWPEFSTACLFLLSSVYWYCCLSLVVGVINCYYSRTCYVSYRGIRGNRAGKRESCIHSTFGLIKALKPVKESDCIGASRLF